MNMSLKVILTAVGIAVLASPVMAQPESHARHVIVPNGYGSAYYVYRHRGAFSHEENNHVPIDDCVRSGFPQCSGGQ
jgi:hypothetical protein